MASFRQFSTPGGDTGGSSTFSYGAASYGGDAGYSATAAASNSASTVANSNTSNSTSNSNSNSAMRTPVKSVSAGRGGAAPDSVGAPPAPTRSVSTPGLSSAFKNPGRLTVRLNQPVENILLKPFSFVCDVTGSLIPANDSRITYSWYRSVDVWECACFQCQQRGEPCVKDGSKPRSRVPVYCNECGKAGAPSATGVFCSVQCFNSAWPDHAARHKPSTERFADGKGVAAVDTTAEAVAASAAEPAQAAGGAGAGAGAGAVTANGTMALKPAPVAVDQDDDEDVKLHASSQLYSVDASFHSDKWLPLVNTKDYVPSHLDVGHRLKLVITAQVGNDLVKTKSVQTRHVVACPPPPKPRKLLHVPLASNTRVMDNHGQFRIVSYNMLAEIYATQQQYRYCPMWALSWAYRRHVLVRELKAYEADIFCLQEVQADYYNTFLEAEMGKLGYEGLYKAKTRASMGAEGKVDGCALFFKKARFQLAETYVIEFNDAAEATYKLNSKPQLRDQHEALLKRLRRDNVAQVVVLKMIRNAAGHTPATPIHVCISNTHLSWNPEFADVKLWQTHMLLKQLEKFTVSRHLPLVLCGDFNSSNDTAVHKLLAGTKGGTARFTGLTRDELPRDPCNILRGGKISHNLTLASAYASVNGGEEPEFTNFTGDFVGCLDYAWLTADRLKVIHYLGIPSRDELTRFANTPLPNAQYPSDHVALVFDMMPVIPTPAAPATATADTETWGN